MWVAKGFSKIGAGYGHGRLDPHPENWKTEVWYCPK